MLLSTKDGIKCDRCGVELRNKFEYYSCKRTRVRVDREKSQTGVSDVEEDLVDFDFCPRCHKMDVAACLGSWEKKHMDNNPFELLEITWGGEKLACRPVDWDSDPNESEFAVPTRYETACPKCGSRVEFNPMTQFVACETCNSSTQINENATYTPQPTPEQPGQTKQTTEIPQPSDDDLTPSVDMGQLEDEPAEIEEEAAEVPHVCSNPDSPCDCNCECQEGPDPEDVDISENELTSLLDLSEESLDDDEFDLGKQLDVTPEQDAKIVTTAAEAAESIDKPAVKPKQKESAMSKLAKSMETTTKKPTKKAPTKKGPAVKKKDDDITGLMNSLKKKL